MHDGVDDDDYDTEPLSDEDLDIAWRKYREEYRRDSGYSGPGVRASIEESVSFKVPAVSHTAGTPVATVYPKATPGRNLKRPSRQPHMRREDKVNVTAKRAIDAKDDDVSCRSVSTTAPSSLDDVLPLYNAVAIRDFAYVS